MQPPILIVAALFAWLAVGLLTYLLACWLKGPPEPRCDAGIHMGGCVLFWPIVLAIMGLMRINKFALWIASFVTPLAIGMAMLHTAAAAEPVKNFGYTPNRAESARFERELLERRRQDNDDKEAQVVDEVLRRLDRERTPRAPERGSSLPPLVAYGLLSFCGGLGLTFIFGGFMYVKEDFEHHPHAKGHLLVGVVLNVIGFAVWLAGFALSL